MKQDKAMELVAALRSGKYQQCRETLHTKDGYCCLGVATDLYPGVEWKITENTSLSYTPVIDGKEQSVAILSQPVMDYFGFQDSVGCISDIRDALAALNDTGSTFDEIANVIEKRWMDL